MRGKFRKPIQVTLIFIFTFALYALIRVASAADGTATATGFFRSAPEFESLTQLTGTTSSTPFQPLPTDTPTPTVTPIPTSTPTNTPTLTATALPTSTPVPPTSVPTDGLPDSAYINDVVGYAQSHTLTCESRSAVDWARFFGVDIEEMDFQAGLPISDNPEVGFVGTIDGSQGQIPPAPYGVHAPPVAALLREYGLTARAVNNISLEKLKKQIVKGNPVIVWVIGNVWYGEPIEYTAEDGSLVTVAYFEHTAIVVGYDEYGLTFVDNNLLYWRSTQAFLDSWSVLGNMAIIRK
jgi:uncharacterized protein YvpB